MELIDSKYKIRCEMGACRNVADKTVKMSRVGIKSRIHICSECLRELYSLIGNELVPKSFETAKRVIGKRAKDSTVDSDKQD